LLPASTILTYNISHNSCELDRYWSWSEISSIDISYEEAMEKLKLLWTKSIHQFYEINKKVGLSLSGGLDSRSILAFSKPFVPDFVFTFGKKNCDDVRNNRRKQ